MSWLDDAVDFGKDVLGKGAGIAAGVFGGPAVGAAVDAGVGWLLGDDEAQTQAAGMGASGGGGAGMSMPPMPGNGNGAVIDMPSGGLQGPVYGTQDMSKYLPQAKQVLKVLAAAPQVGQLVQRFWDFPRGEQTRQQHSDLAWQQLANQLPPHMREALEQFLLGFSAPIGLSKSAEDAFLLLTIAEAGYSPTALGLCSVQK